jgi:hypothetical protein
MHTHACRHSHFANAWDSVIPGSMLSVEALLARGNLRGAIHDIRRIKWRSGDRTALETPDPSEA